MPPKQRQDLPAFKDLIAADADYEVHRLRRKQKIRELSNEYERIFEERIEEVYDAKRGDMVRVREKLNEVKAYADHWIRRGAKRAYEKATATARDITATQRTMDRIEYLQATSPEAGTAARAQLTGAGPSRAIEGPRPPSLEEVTEDQVEAAPGSDSKRQKTA
ncbi:hypothetical protein HDV00_001086 [Rhizophlyctis rosea]|nr:hypothetical protein HDV00_001086 [Rhizophlyctis rosea]